jgi:hypothetical protein
MDRAPNRCRSRRARARGRLRPALIKFAVQGRELASFRDLSARALLGRLTRDTAPVAAARPDAARTPIGDAASGRREARLDVVIHAEEIGGIVFLLDRRQPL